LNGKAMDTFGPGRYSLETENLPLLKKAYSLPTNKQNPFHAEVYFINKAVGMKTLRRPRVCVNVPIDATEVEKKAVYDATMAAGARDVILVETPIAAALGAGIDVSRPTGSLIVDIGAGTTDIALICMGEAVRSICVKTGGQDFDEAIINFMRETHSMLVGEQTAENVKIDLGTISGDASGRSVMVSGRDIITGLPGSVAVPAAKLDEAFKEPLDSIMRGLKKVLGNAQPELASDIINRGIILTGGGSCMGGIEELIESELNIRTTTVDHPMAVVAIGTGRYVEYSERINAQSGSVGQRQ
ncbi:MAG: rod shape-determining protein, partial [Lachnospiraceae bacterium]|nr:rod shape-determining protein [Lachnospiraceae bacterium]